MQRVSLQRCLSAKMLSLLFPPRLTEVKNIWEGLAGQVYIDTHYICINDVTRPFRFLHAPSARLRHFRLRGAKVETALRQHYQVSLNLNPSGTREQSTVPFASSVGQNKKFPN